MPSPAAPRVFISYSSKDADIVGRVRKALADAGVAVWLDHEQLTPGTPDWRAAVLRGIEQATTVIYAASPEAASSKYVAHELAIAEGEGKTILPFWIRGEKWYFCAPMGFYVAQHIDGRDTAYASGLAKLQATLGATTAAPVAATPVHAPVERRPAAPQPAPATTPVRPTYPYAVPERLASLGFGFRVANPQAAPAIVPPLVSVAAGPFLMGSDPAHDPEAYDDETPQHRVEVDAFRIGKYPVTVAEYALAVRAKTVPEPPEEGGMSWQTQLQRLDHPVVNVSWQDAQAYLKWLREASGEPDWRLPTEAEWEKAARWDPRANASRIYPWGDSFDTNRCNTRESGIGHATPVGSYPASDERRSGASLWGSEELAGNVWEWTSSLLEPYPYARTDGREAPDSIENRARRGGSWYNNARNARAACRLDLRPDNRSRNCGFRLALSRPSAGG